MASTLLQLRKRVLDHLNDLQDEATATGDRYKTAALNRFLNAAVRHYANRLNAFYQGYLSVTVPLNIVGGTSSYDLGPTFRSPIYEVRRVIDNVDYFLNPIHTYYGIMTLDTVPNTNWLPSYHLEGSTILFSQVPQTNETAAVIIKHQKKLAELTSDVSALDDQLYDAEDCIVLKTVIWALKSKDVSGALKNISGHEAELKDSEGVFYSQVGNRYVKPDKPIPVDDLNDNFL